MIILSENLDQFSEKVHKGDLDLLLAKPVNSQFMISLQKGVDGDDWKFAACFRLVYLQFDSSFEFLNGYAYFGFWF